MNNLDPTVDSVSLSFVKPGSGAAPFQIDNWTSYLIESDFFVPSDRFSFECGDDRVEQLRNKIRLSDEVVIKVNDYPEIRGYVEKVEMDYSTGGTKLRISGRDILGVIIDGTISPKLKITGESTFEEALYLAFKAAGWDKEKITFFTRDRLSAKFHPLTIQAGSGRSKGQKIGHQLKPRKNEGFMEFAMRICARSGWNVHLSPGGEYINIGMPNYAAGFMDFMHQTLIHRINEPNLNNILSGSLTIDWAKQPSYIIGEATGAGGKFRKGINSVFVPNHLMLDSDKILLIGYSDVTPKKIKMVANNYNLINNIPNMIRKLYPTGSNAINNSKYPNPKEKPLYEYDDESKNMDSLEYVMRKKMADFQNSFFTLNYSVSGHSYIGGNNQLYNYDIDSMIRVIDDTYELDNIFWVQKKVLTKSRSGTKTDLTLKLPYIYEFPDLKEEK